MRARSTFLLALLTLGGCEFPAGEDGEGCKVDNREDGSTVVTCGSSTTVIPPAGGCTVADDGDGTRTIRCSDGTSTIIADGSDGSSCTVRDEGDGSKTILCTDGTRGTFRDGADAVSCRLERRDDSTLLMTCPDGSTTILPVDTCDGTIRGADFDDPFGWTVAGGAYVDPLASDHGGRIGPGSLHFGTEAICNRGRAEQRICVPPYDGEPLRFETSGFIEGCTDYACMSLPVALANGRNVAYGVGFVDFSPGFTCLGEKHYGRAYTLSITGGAPAANCPDGPTITYEFDRFALAPAPDMCPPPGTILNGSFDLQDGIGWILESSQALAEWHFDGTDREAHLATTTGTCGHAAVSGWISVPSEPELPHLAIEFTARGNAGDRLRIASPYGRPEVIATGEPQTVRLCVPPSEYGWAGRLEIFTSLAGDCSAPGSDWFIDDVRFVSDPACAALAH